MQSVVNSATFASGNVIAARYELELMLGEGGSASVWRAYDSRLERPVAIKFIYNKDERYRGQQIDRFTREARLACAVQHPNVIHTMDFGVVFGRAYMVMELIEGDDLAERMIRQPAMKASEIVRVIDGVLQGLSAIHEAGIVHNDLKPENIFLLETAGGLHPKIIDFGIARNVDPKNSRKSVLTTDEGIMIGTPEYMSPEQIRGLPDIDHRTDLWSAAVMLYELLCGQLPHDLPNSGDLVIAIATTDARRISDIRPSIPRALSDFMSKALSRERSARYQNATEMLLALREATRTLDDASFAENAMPLTARAARSPTKRATRERPANIRWRSPQAQLARRAAIAGLALLLLAAGAWFMRSRSTSVVIESPTAEITQPVAAPKLPPTVEPAIERGAEPVNLAQPAPPPTAATPAQPKARPKATLAPVAETPEKPIKRRTATPTHKDSPVWRKLDF